MPNILIVDDDPHTRRLLAQVLEALEDEGVELVFADNGERALQIIVEATPELVFLDIMMPKLSGIDVCSVVKHQSRLDEVFIVLLTAKGQETDRLAGEAAGADLYLTKPFDPEDIVALARRVLGLPGTARPQPAG